MGPLPRTEKGNRYVLVIMDYFTKWPEVYPMENQEATTIADILVGSVVVRHGVPRELHSDQGRNFESRVFQGMCKLLGIKKTRTTALHPQSDGMVERFKRTIQQHLPLFVSKRQ
ncbi:transposase family protein [Salmonella enterica subsp. enterica serovar Typhimurium]|nr:transposase family protein [Salmonella enterica subsp. enterica serovar Typhimurium]